MADYCTLAEVKALLPESGLASSTDYDGALSFLITSASRAIDREVGQYANYFYPSTAAETRYFDGNGMRTIRIDDVVSITSVGVAEQGGTSSSDYTTLSSSDYQPLPHNAATVGIPFSELRMDVINGSQSVVTWTPFEKAVKVVGVFGYAATPPQDVKQAAVIQSVRWYMASKQAYQQFGAAADISQPSYSKLDPDISKLLNPYKIGAIA